VVLVAQVEVEAVLEEGVVVVVLLLHVTHSATVAARFAVLLGVVVVETTRVDTEAVA